MLLQKAGRAAQNIPMSEVWMNIVTEGSGLRPQKNSRIDYPTLYFLVKKYNN